MRALHVVVADVKKRLANGHVPATLVRELLDWVDAAPSPGERALAEASKVDAAELVALPVMLAPTGQGQLTDMPQGSFVVTQWALALPYASFRHSRVLGTDGQVQNPLEGLLPAMAARLVLPKRRMQPEILAGLGMEVPPPPMLLRE